jgi:hypothetical protein
MAWQTGLGNGNQVISAYFGSWPTKLPAMSDEELLQAWRTAVTTGVDQRITLAESAAIVRFGIAGWRQHYAARFSDQTYYQFPRKPG